MKLGSIARTALHWGLFVFLLALSIEANAAPYSIASDSNLLWTFSDANGQPLGNAQTVCLAAGPGCPAGATPYGYPFPGWAADLSSIPGAKWIWAPNITGDTSPAGNTEFTVETQFWLCGAPTAGKIWAAADNSAEVSLNGQSVLTTTDNATLAMVDLAANNRLALINQGLNVIQVKVKNAANPPDCGSDKYQCNPAGVVLGASFQDALSALPTCSSGGRTFNLGEFETLSCPPGKTGSRGRPCACIGSIGFWGPVYDACTSPQPPPLTCASGGVTFAAGSTETLACPAGQTGSRTRTCNTNGAWGQISGTCASPPVTCSSNGATFAVGATETLSCPAGRVGARTRVCGGDGAWGQIAEACRLPDVALGAICGSKDQGNTGTCPAGTTCGPRLSPARPKPPECFFGINCPVRLLTTDWFCDP